MTVPRTTLPYLVMQIAFSPTFVGFSLPGLHRIPSSASRIVRYASLAPGMGVLSVWRWSHTLASSIVSGIPSFFRHFPINRDSFIHNTAPFIVDKTTIVAIWFLVAVSAQPLECSFYAVFHVFFSSSSPHRTGLPHQGQKFTNPAHLPLNGLKQREHQPTRSFPYSSRCSFVGGSIMASPSRRFAYSSLALLYPASQARFQTNSAFRSASRSTNSRVLLSIVFLAFFRHLPVTGDSDVQNTVPVTGGETAIVAIGFLGAVSAQPLKCLFNKTSHIFPSITQRFSAAWAYPERLAARGADSRDGCSRTRSWAGGIVRLPPHPQRTYP